jgi:HEAT repeat protein
MLDTMVGSEGRRTWLEAARLLRWLPDGFESQLLRLLHDDEPDVAREAVIAAGARDLREFVPDIIRRLGDPLIVPDAVDALAAFGEGSVPALRSQLGDRSVARAIRREIPAVLLRIETSAAHAALAAHLGEPDPRIRFRIVTALNKLSQMHSEWRVDEAVVTPILEVEIAGLYRSYQLMGALRRHSATAERALAVFADTIGHDTERIFRLLKVLHPESDFHSMYVGLQSKSLVVHDNALELIEATLAPRLRERIVPLFDGAVSTTAHERAADRVVGVSIRTVEDLRRQIELIDDPLLREAAEEALAGVATPGFDQRQATAGD